LKEHIGETIGSKYITDVRGKARVVNGSEDFEKMVAGEIVVAKTIHPYQAPYLLKSKGIVVEEATRLQHASILAREVGIPCITIKDAVNIFKNGDTLLLKSQQGKVISLD